MMPDVMGRGIKEYPPWCMLFADNTVLCTTRSDYAERKFGEWRRAMEERVLKDIRKKIAYLWCNEHKDAETHWQGERVKIMQTFTYL